MQYYSLQYRILLSSPDTSTIEHHFRFGPAASFFLEVLVIVLYSSPVAYWTPSNLGGSTFSVISFCLFLYSSWGSCGQNTGVVCYSLLQWIVFCENSPLWPIRLVWPYKAWLIASLSSASPFAKTRQWSMKRILYINYLINQETFTDNLLSTIWHQSRQCEEDKEL